MVRIVETKERGQNYLPTGYSVKSPGLVLDVCVKISLWNKIKYTLLKWIRSTILDHLAAHLLYIYRYIHLVKVLPVHVHPLSDIK